MKLVPGVFVLMCCALRLSCQQDQASLPFLPPELWREIAKLFPIFYQLESFVLNNPCDISLPDGVSDIPEFMLIGNRQLKSVCLPPSISLIDEDAFQNCIGLHNVVLNDGLRHIAARAFSGCVELNEVVLPFSVCSLEEEAFSGCLSLHRVVLNEGLRSLGLGVFKGCVSLQSIVLPQSVGVIGSQAFEGCCLLSEVALSESLLLCLTPGDCKTIGFNESLVSALMDAKEELQLMKQSVPYDVAQLVQSSVPAMITVTSLQLPVCAIRP